MKYDQSEAKNRFEGLLGLFKKIHDKVKEPINTLTEFTALDMEAKLLVAAFDEEINLYMQRCGHETMYKPTITLILNIQSLAACTGGHLIIAQARLNHIYKESEGIEKAAEAADSMRWN